MTAGDDNPLAPMQVAGQARRTIGDHPGSLPLPLRGTVARMLRRIIRDERLAARRVRIAIGFAEQLDDRLELAEVLRDELRHAVAAQRLLDRLSGSTEASGRSDEQLALDAPDGLVFPFVPNAPSAPSADEALVGTWTALAIADRAAMLRYAELAGAGWAPLARDARSWAADERRHAALGAYRLRRMADRPELRSMIRGAVDRVLPATLAGFGIEEPPDLPDRQAAQVDIAPPGDLRAQLRREVRELLDGCRLAMPTWSPPWDRERGADAAAVAEPLLVIGG